MHPEILYCLHVMKRQYVIRNVNVLLVYEKLRVYLLDLRMVNRLLRKSFVVLVHQYVMALKPL